MQTNKGRGHPFVIQGTCHVVSALAQDTRVSFSATKEQGPGSDEVYVGDEAAKTHSWGTKPHSWGIFTLFFPFRLDFVMEADGSR